MIGPDPHDDLRLGCHGWCWLAGLDARGKPYPAQAWAIATGFFKVGQQIPLIPTAWALA